MSFDHSAYRRARRREGKDRPVRTVDGVTTENAALCRVDPDDYSHPESDVSRGEHE